MKELTNQAAQNAMRYAGISRRSFLKGALAVGGALALAGCGKTVTDPDPVPGTVPGTGVVAPPTVQTVPTFSELSGVVAVPSYLLVDYVKCVGCSRCMIACTLEHFGETDLRKSNIKVYGISLNGAWLDIPILCMKCTDTPCVASCPPAVSALSVDEVTGSILIDKEKCTACNICVEVCNDERTGCLSLSEDHMEVYGFCDMCGGTPQCVLACPEDVLQIHITSTGTPGQIFAKKPFELAQQVWPIIYRT